MSDTGSHQTDIINQYHEENRKLTEALSTSEAAREKAESDAERERLRLAACGVLALGDRRYVHTDYRSASLDDVGRLLDTCDSLRAELSEAKRQAEFWQGRLNDSTRDGSRLESALASKTQEVEAMRLALDRICAESWTGIYDGSGPSDCTPNEKGLLEYVGRVFSIAKDALSRLSEARKQK